MSEKLSKKLQPCESDILLTAPSVNLCSVFRCRYGRYSNLSSIISHEFLRELIASATIWTSYRA